MAHSRVLINLTRGADDPDRATVAFVMANAAVTLDKTTVVLLSTEGVRIGVADAIEAIHETGFLPLKELVDTFLEAGGEIWACTPCVAKRGLEDRLHPRIRKVGAVAAIEFVCEDGVSVSF
jgi:predicted peroxiredoxin